VWLVFVGLRVGWEVVVGGVWFVLMLGVGRSVVSFVVCVGWLGLLCCGGSCFLGGGKDGGLGGLGGCVL